MILFDISPQEASIILFDAEIWERIKVVDEKPELPTDNTIYIGGYVNGKLIGVMVYYKRPDRVTCHIHVLKDYRAKYGIEFGKESLKLSPSKTLFTNIPENYGDVKRFAEYFNFKQIGKALYKRG